MKNSANFLRVNFLKLMIRLQFFVITLSLICATNSSILASDLYKIDPSHTNLTWRADHFGFSKPNGKFTNIDGKIILDQDSPQNSSVEALIYTNSINTGFPKLDTHLKSADFFDVDKFPTATFKSTSVKNIGNNNAKVAGILTIKEISRPIIFDVKINKIGKNPLTQNKTIGITISGTIKRADYGINYGIPGIGNDVKIDIESEAIYQSSINGANTQNTNSEWRIINDKSKIEFMAKQNNSNIKGSFKKFNGKINFDPNLLEKSSVMIEIDMNSLDMSFAEALETAKNPTWLAIGAYPKAIFKSDKFIAMPGKNNYSAKGFLELKGKNVPIALNFNLKAIDNKFAYAIGSVVVKRNDYNVGDRSVANANGVADEVIVNFEVQANKNFQ